MKQRYVVTLKQETLLGQTHPLLLLYHFLLTEQILSLYNRVKGSLFGKSGLVSLPESHGHDLKKYDLTLKYFNFIFYSVFKCFV